MRRAGSCLLSMFVLAALALLSRPVFAAGSVSVLIIPSGLAEVTLVAPDGSTLTKRTTTGVVSFDPRDAGLRREMEKRSAEEAERRRETFRSRGVDAIEVRTDRSYMEPLFRFFRMRERRFR